MSRHRAYQNYDYENDLDEYDGGQPGQGEDRLSPEDQELLSKGTAEVTTCLGPEAHKVPVDQIQEALWYYYFDVEKAVAYLTTKFISPPAPKPTKNKAKLEPDGKRNSSTYSDPPFPPLPSPCSIS